ncbi:alpha/beta hydrolase [Sphingomonas psychrotolerans]|nr:alpha/beta hydrolase [Sphingomonas psychrotolerans]
MRPVLTILAALWLVLAYQQAIAQSAGMLSAAEPVAVTPAGMQAWRVRYWTTDDRERPIEVTGMVVAPRNPRPATPRPVLAWAHGTSGVVERCAPSLSEKFFASTPGLNEAIRRGYTVVAPDYPGLGSAMPHPYLGGVATARSVLDAVRSARGIPGAAASTRFAVWGESQGGHAALWTGQLARIYAPDLQLVGVAAAAPPTDLVENLRAGGNPSVRAFLTAFVAYSWSQHFGAPLSTLGNRTTQGVITRLARNNCNEPGMKPRLGTMLGTLSLRSALKNVDLGLIQPWARIARENSPAARPYGVPLLIAQNPNDAIVGAEVTRRFARQMCGNGTRLRYLAIAGKGHQTSGADSAGVTLDWIDARFARAAAPSDCGKI